MNPYDDGEARGTFTTTVFASDECVRRTERVPPRTLHALNALEDALSFSVAPGPAQMRQPVRIGGAMGWMRSSRGLVPTRTSSDDTLGGYRRSLTGARDKMVALWCSDTSGPRAQLLNAMNALLEVSTRKRNAPYAFTHEQVRSALARRLEISFSSPSNLAQAAPKVAAAALQLAALGGVKLSHMTGHANETLKSAFLVAWTGLSRALAVSEDAMVHAHGFQVHEFTSTSLLMAANGIADAFASTYLPPLEGHEHDYRSSFTPYEVAARAVVLGLTLSDSVWHENERFNTVSASVVADDLLGRLNTRTTMRAHLQPLVADALCCVTALPANAYYQVTEAPAVELRPLARAYTFACLQAIQNDDKPTLVPPLRVFDADVYLAKIDDYLDRERRVNVPASDEEIEEDEEEPFTLRPKPPQKGGQKEEEEEGEENDEEQAQSTSVVEENDQAPTAAQEQVQEQE